MESIKHKMEELVQQKEASTKLAEELEAAASGFKDGATAHSSTIEKTEKGINGLENDLDDTMTKTIASNEKFDETDKIATESELQVNGLTRKLQLIEEETKRVNDRLAEVLSKLAEVEASGEDNERQRKVLEATSFTNEEKYEIQDAQLLEARQIAEEATHKQDEAGRKLKMVEEEHSRMSDKAEEFEGKASEYEAKLDENRAKLKELEEQAGICAEKEDKYEESVRTLSSSLNNEESRAEFAERTVDKLESSIDKLQEDLFSEKNAFIEMSKKLDQTLNDMMNI